MAETTGGLYRKIVAVMRQVNRIPKNGYNDFHKYRYALEADVVEAIRPILCEVGLALTFTCGDYTRDGDVTHVPVKFRLVDVDTGEVEESTVWGAGQDKGDKGVYKAYTGAQKYYLMKTFHIPTGDDPESPGQEGDGGKGEPKQRPRTAAPKAENKPSASPRQQQPPQQEQPPKPGTRGPLDSEKVLFLAAGKPQALQKALTNEKWDEAVKLYAPLCKFTSYDDLLAAAKRFKYEGMDVDELALTHDIVAFEEKTHTPERLAKLWQDILAGKRAPSEV